MGEVPTVHYFDTIGTMRVQFETVEAGKCSQCAAPLPGYVCQECGDVATSATIAGGIQVFSCRRHLALVDRRLLESLVVQAA
jgi:predicted RNA-binding protein with PUA domain